MYDRFLTSKLIDLWLAEDIGNVDLTAQLMVDADVETTFYMNAREPMTLAGLEVAAAVFQRYEPRCKIEMKSADGQRVEKGTPLLVVSGPAQALLTAERTAL